MADKVEAKANRTETKTRKKEVSEPPVEPDETLALAAAQFKALGDPTRLRIINLLSSVKEIESDDETADEPEAGRTVGDVSLGIFGKTKVSSTLSHHLKELRNAGLITMKRRGKNLICRIQANAVETLRCYLPQPAPEIPAPPKAETPTPAVRTMVRKRAIRKQVSVEGGSQENVINKHVDDAAAV